MVSAIHVPEDAPGLPWALQPPPAQRAQRPHPPASPALAGPPGPHPSCTGRLPSAKGTEQMTQRLF